MKLRMHPHQPLLPAVLASLLAFTSCANLFNSQPSISEVILTTSFVSDYRPVDNTAVFYIDSPEVCCSAKVAGAVPGTTIKASWIFVKDGMAKQDMPLIREDKVPCDKDGYIGFTLPAPASGFITGDYRIELSINSVQKAAVLFAIHKDRSMPIPQIESFTANPLKITAGQPAILNWKVYNATSVDIQPSPGIVATEGSHSISPTVETTYTLCALNRGGISSSTLTISVTPIVKEKADLQVTDFWSSGNVLSYHIKNIGNLSSCPTMTYLYKNDLLESKDYVGPLAPGEERVEALMQYHFSPRFTSSLAEATSDAVNIRICANAEAACVESDNSNNCLEHNFGSLLSVNLTHYAHIAQWKTDTAILKWPIFKDSNDGSAYISTALVAGDSYPGTLLMSPPPAGGWIQGTFGLLRGSPPALQPFYIPHKCKFTCKMGLTYDVQTPSSAKFLLGIMQGNEVTYFPPVTIDSKDKVEAYEVDMSTLAGKEVNFIFRIETGGPWQQGNAAWIEPLLTQER